MDRWYDAGSTATNEVPDAVKLGNSSLARGNEIKLRQVVNSDLLIPVDLCQSMYDALSTASFTLRVPVEYGVWCASMIDAGDVIEDIIDDHFDACVVRFGSLEGVCLPLWHGQSVPGAFFGYQLNCVLGKTHMQPVEVHSPVRWCLIVLVSQLFGARAIAGTPEFILVEALLSSDRNLKQWSFHQDQCAACDGFCSNHVTAIWTLRFDSVLRRHNDDERGSGV